jgi:hypothetical protein
MKRHTLALLLLGAAHPLAAEQQPTTEPGQRPWSLGLGAGVISSASQGDAYFSVNLRRRVGRPRDGDTAERTGFRMTPRGEGLRAYLELEFGRFERESDRFVDRDHLLGLNVVGVVPARAVDIFLGVGFGAHQFETRTRATGATTDDVRLGGNAQFGVELNLGGRAGLFGVGRVDFLEGELLGQQSKVWGGVRLRF